MRLVVDTSALARILLRETSRDRLDHPRLDLYLTEHTLGEVHEVLPRRITGLAKSRGFDAADRVRLLARCLDTVDNSLTLVPCERYASFEDEARARYSQDPTDWPPVAYAMAINAAIWTDDRDFFGTGVATWTTSNLLAWLDRQPSPD